MKKMLNNIWRTLPYGLMRPAPCGTASQRTGRQHVVIQRAANDAQAKREAKERANYLSDANEHSLVYLGQARQFREQGRYELARQRYLQALSICADDQTLGIIKRELNGVELLLRTMR